MWLRARALLLLQLNRNDVFLFAIIFGMRKRIFVIQNVVAIYYLCKTNWNFSAAASEKINMKNDNDDKQLGPFGLAWLRRHFVHCSFFSLCSIHLSGSKCKLAFVNSS